MSSQPYYRGLDTLDSFVKIKSQGQHNPQLGERPTLSNKQEELGLGAQEPHFPLRLHSGHSPREPGGDRESDLPAPFEILSSCPCLSLPLSFFVLFLLGVSLVSSPQLSLSVTSHGSSRRQSSSTQGCSPALPSAPNPMHQSPRLSSRLCLRSDSDIAHLDPGVTAPWGSSCFIWVRGVNCYSS